MGLDMYLSRKFYIGANYEHRNIKGEINITKDGEPVEIDFSKVTYIEEEVMSWRKSNQIHKWFVDNVQNGVDDCGTYPVSIEQLRELVRLCQEVLKKANTIDGQVWNGSTWTKAEGEVDNYKDGLVITNQDEIAELLPTQGGFFFGGTDYDEYYLRDIERTIKELTPYLEDNISEFTYSSSW